MGGLIKTALEKARAKQPHTKVRKQFLFSQCSGLVPLGPNLVDRNDTSHVENPEQNLEQ